MKSIVGRNPTMFDWEGLFSAIGFITFVIVCSIILTDLISKLFGRYL